MHFSSPLALLLFLLLPAIAALGWPSRGYGRRREIASLALRLVIILSLILALAGLSFLYASRNLAVVFLIDISDSMPETAITAAVSYTRQALQQMRPDDQAAIIVFGAEALVERPMSSGREFGSLTSIPVTNATDLAQAMRLALALYPPGAARRMVILSDGADTVNRENPAALLDTARLAAASGVELMVLPFITETGPEVLVTDLEAPNHLRQGERFDLHLTVQATRSTRIDLRVLENDQVIFEGSQNLKQGRNSFSLPLTAGMPGFNRYQVQIVSPEDHYYQNNELATYTQVIGPPKVLLVVPPQGEPMGFSAAARPDEASALIAALRAGGYVIETVQPAELPANLSELAGYASLVLVDVPARDLSQRQMLALQTYVRDLGGGLTVVGGPTSYGVGGYFRTPLEEILPVEMQIKDEQRRPSLTIVLIIDRSGSMSEISSGTTKLELAKEAAMRSVELLAPMDQVGVIAFDESASWVVPITALENPEQVIHAIGTIQPGGGTDILAGLQAMAKILPEQGSLVKHAILLTDGGADPTGIPELVSQLYTENNITLSTVGVGRDAAPFLKDLAKLGGGRYHFTADPNSIPSIFTEETTLATRAYLVEEAFYPALNSASPILSGIDALPPLYGYVGTSPKEAAQIILISERNDPILAAWQYGLGKVVAFTSDATGRWGKDWVGWQGFPIFWAQALRYTVGLESASPLEIKVETVGEETRLVVDAFSYEKSSNGGSNLYLNNYLMQARVIDPQGSTTEVQLRQVAPGRYEGVFAPAQEGVYMLRVSGSAPNGEASVAETAGWVLAYSPEYRQLDSEPDTLARIAAAASGRFAPQEAGEIFSHTLLASSIPRPKRSDAWPWLLALAALLLPFDIAVRRLVIAPADLRSAWAKIARKLARKPSEAVPQRGRPRYLEAIFQAKEQARQARLQTPPTPGPMPELRPLTQRDQATPSTAHPLSANTDLHAAQNSSPAASTISTLLERKRRIQGKHNLGKKDE